MTRLLSRDRLQTRTVIPVAVRLLPVLVFAVIAACNERSPSTPAGVTVFDSVGVRIVESSAPLLAAPDELVVIDEAAALVIGAEAGDELYQLHRVSDATSLPDGRIVIANSGSSELRVFDSEGVFIARAGRQGAGPGEFGAFAATRLHFVQGELLATDPGLFRLHAFDSTLALIETRSFTLSAELPRPLLRGVFDDGSWLAIAFDAGGSLRGAPGSVIGTSFAITIHDARGKLLRRFGRFDGRKRYVNAVGEITHYPQLPFTSDAVVQPYGKQILVLRGDQPEVELWDTDGTLRTRMRWSRERVRSADWYARYRDEAVAALATASERDRRLYGAFYEKDLPLPEFAAMYDEVVVDSARRIWVRRYRLPGDTGDEQWDVLDDSGQWLGTTSTPRGLEIFEIGSSHLLGRVRDSLGVERVVLHALRAGGRTPTRSGAGR